MVDILNQMESEKKNHSFTFSEWVMRIPESEIRRLLRYSPKYYFAGGKPGVIPVPIFHTIIQELLDEERKMLIENKIASLAHYNYGPTEGNQQLREVLARRLNQRDGLINIEASDILITTGSQQSLFALCDTIISPGDILLTTRPSYLGFLQTAEKAGGKIVTIPSDEQGMITDYIPSAINLCKRKFGKSPKVLYSVPYSDNPKGTTLPTNRKEAIIDYSYDFDYLVIEDMAYKEIQFDSNEISPMKRFDVSNERVAYLSTTTKEAAAFRIGYSVLPSEIHNEVVKAKGIYDLCSSEWVQAIITRYYEKYIDKALPDIIKEYKKRRESMAAAINENLKGEATSPTGGFFIWFKTTDKTFDSSKFIETALANDISYVPGATFFPLKGFNYNENREISECVPEHNAMRLSYSFMTPKMIEEGISQLGKLIASST
jgi:2-aminoadipate transaminase